MRTDAASRVVILGLDGATLDLIEPWAREGILPHLDRILREGAWGTLRSTLPAVTAPAWTSFATGKNPGKHGLYDFVTLDVSTNRLIYANSQTCRGERLWEILSRHGKRVCVINVPMTYPPHPVNGILVTGMMTPGVDSPFVYPPERQQELRERFPNYVISAAAGKNMADYPKNLQKMVRARAELAMYLLEHEAWDFFMLVFTATDLVQHMFWRAMLEPDHPQHDAIREIYQLVDAQIGAIRERLPEDALLLLMSDHGAGPIRKQVHLNRWLEENGYLAYRTPSEGWLHRALKALTVRAFILWRTRLPLGVREAIRNLSPRFQNLGVSEKVEAMASAPIDWSRTRAYHAGTYGNLRLNLRGRERYGIVSPGEEYERLRKELIERLRDLRDPDTGTPVVARVVKREEAYQGPYLEQAPDLLIEWTDEAYWSDARFGKRSERVFEDQYNVPLLTTAISAIHKRQGIFMATGPEIVPQRVQGADIVDITPTVLYAMGLPVAQDMDGRPLTQLFSEDFQATHPIRREAAGESATDAEGEVFSEEDRQKVEERLRDLGYLG